MKKRITTSFLLCVLGSLLTTAAFGQARWQWIDDKGRKVFSDQAPAPEVPEKNIIKRPSRHHPPVVDTSTTSPAKTTNPESSKNPASNSASGIDKELEAKKKKAAEAEANKRKAAEEQVSKMKRENCERAKQDKATLNSGVRIARTAQNGEREILDETARSQELKRIDSIIATDCQ
jgi:hypothetical protein